VSVPELASTSHRSRGYLSLLTAFISQMLPNLERMTREYVYQFSPSLWNADLRVARPKTSSDLPNRECRMLRTQCLGFERRGSRHYRGSTMNSRGLLRQVPRTFYLGAPPELRGRAKRAKPLPKQEFKCAEVVEERNPSWLIFEHPFV
jgi:hypothetical protein